MQANVGKRKVRTLRLLGRCILVLAAETAAGTGLYRLVRPSFVQVYAAATSEQTAQPWSLEHLVVDAAAVLAGIVFAVLATSSLATLVVGLSPTGRMLTACGWMSGPAWWRRAVLVACGLGFAAPVTAGASHAVEHAHGSCAAGCAAQARLTPSTLSGLQLPDLPVLPHLRPDRHRHVVVRPGDSLWLISRSLAAPSASDAAVGRLVADLYRANRPTIGPDADLIYPGTDLITPGDIR